MAEIALSAVQHLLLSFNDEAQFQDAKAVLCDVPNPSVLVHSFDEQSIPRTISILCKCDYVKELSEIYSEPIGGVFARGTRVSYSRDTYPWERDIDGLPASIVKNGFVRGYNPSQSEGKPYLVKEDDGGIIPLLESDLTLI